MSAAEPVHLVISTAHVLPGHLDAVVALFQETNPGLVAAEPDWLGAEISADPEAGTVVVIARWRSADSYRRFAASDVFRGAMDRFAPHLAGPPTVWVVERRWSMGDLL